jgi:hypothetical protein
MENYEIKPPTRAYKTERAGCENTYSTTQVYFTNTNQNYTNLGITYQNTANAIKLTETIFQRQQGRRERTQLTHIQHIGLETTEEITNWITLCKIKFHFITNWITIV